MQSIPPEESVEKENEADLVTSELEVLVKKQSEMEQDIIKTSEKIKRLVIISGDEKLIDEVRETSFTNGVRVILASADAPLTSIELGFDTGGYSNFLASLHHTLERMKRQGEVIETFNEIGKKQYSKTVKLRRPR